jgi:hypothetical protein
VRSVARGIAVSVFCVTVAVNGGFLISRGANELPDLRVGDSASRRGRRILWDHVSGRWRASIVVNPINEFRGTDLFTDEVGSDKREAFAFINWY